MISVRTAALSAAALLALSGLTACGSTDSTSSASSSESASATPSESASSTPSESPAPSESPSKAASKAPSKAPSRAASKAPAAPVVITIKGYAYSGPSSVAPGTKITVTNDDTVAHTVTAKTDSAFDVAVPAGASATFTAPSKAGSYAFYCLYHSNMQGTLKVS